MTPQDYDDQDLPDLADFLPVDDIATFQTAFDAAFYLDRYPEVAETGLDPAFHYLERGWKAGFDPSPAFSTEFYLEDNADVANAGVNPFWHYLIHGQHENRAPLPPSPEVLALDGALRAEVETMRPHFDVAFYLKTYPDVGEAGRDPLAHFAQEGWREGRDPSPVFSTRFYLAENEDVEQAGVNPFWHYVVDGQREGRPALPPSPELAALDDTQRAEFEAMHDHFDADFYRATYPDVVEAGRDPLIHYTVDGWKAGYDPSPNFSTRFYLTDNTDVAKAGVNPFWHYLVVGQGEGRRPVPPNPRRRPRGGADDGGHPGG